MKYQPTSASAAAWRGFIDVKSGGFSVQQLGLVISRVPPSDWWHPKIE